MSIAISDNHIRLLSGKTGVRRAKQFFLYRFQLNKLSDKQIGICNITATINIIHHIIRTDTEFHFNVYSKSKVLAAYRISSDQARLFTRQVYFFLFS
jgi:hypothetical protein